jgi:ATP phosphoribosyltransferase
MSQLTIALAKGRIFKETLPLLKKAGIIISASDLNSRKLILPTNHDNISVVVLRSSDVAIFVEHGAADIGVVGLDSLLEHSGKGLYELLDLNIAKCKLSLAAKPNADLNKTPLKVATKYTKMTADYFKNKKQAVEIIKLYGAMELAPIVDLSHCIVDLVDTGNTLKANGLEIVDDVKINISTRLIANIASYKTKNDTIKNLVNLLQKEL